MFTVRRCAILLALPRGLTLLYKIVKLVYCIIYYENRSCYKGFLNSKVELAIKYPNFLITSIQSVEDIKVIFMVAKSLEIRHWLR